MNALEKDVLLYLRYLEGVGDTVNYGHNRLAYLWKTYGKENVQAFLDAEETKLIENHEQKRKRRVRP